MRPTALLLAAACALLAPSVTSAQLSVGGQAGAAFPLGSERAGTKLSDVVARAFPLELRATWRVAPAVAVGLQGGYEVASDADARSKTCTATATSCTSRLWRVAARGEYAFEGEKWRPFAAATLGWEWEALGWKQRPGNWEDTRRGGWLLGAEGGVDHPVKPGSHFKLGAYAGFWVAQYVTLTVSGANAGYRYSDSGAEPNPAVHGWFGVGLRGTFDFADFAAGAEPSPAAAGAPR